MAEVKEAGLELEYATQLRGLPQNDLAFRRRHGISLDATQLPYSLSHYLFDNSSSALRIFKAVQAYYGPEELGRFQEHSQHFLHPQGNDWMDTDYMNDSFGLRLPNAARHYLDHGLPEYASAPGLTTAEIIRQHFAGDRLMSHVVDAAQADLQQAFWDTFRGADGLGPRDKSISEVLTTAFTPEVIEALSLVISKRGSDGLGHSEGVHLSVNTARHTAAGTPILEDVIKYLPKALCALMPIFGGGKLGGEAGINSSTRDAFRFQLSQRADFIHELSSQETMRSRPLINTRDQPFSNNSFRQHLICLDPLLSQRQTYYIVGAMRIIYAMIEDCYFARKPFHPLEDPVRAFKFASQSPDLNAKLILEGGKKVSQEQLLRDLLKDMRSYLNGSNKDCFGDEDPLAIVDALDDVANRMFDNWSTATEIDWVARRWNVEAVFEKAGFSWEELRNNPARSVRNLDDDTADVYERMRAKDLNFSVIARGNNSDPTPHQLWENGAAKKWPDRPSMQMFSDIDLDMALWEPPEGRAATYSWLAHTSLPLGRDDAHLPDSSWSQVRFFSRERHDWVARIQPGTVLADPLTSKGGISSDRIVELDYPGISFTRSS